MAFTSQLNRIGRLAIAPGRGFFSFRTETTMPNFDTTWWAYVKAVARRDAILYFEPFKFAARAFKQERARPGDKR